MSRICPTFPGQRGTEVQSNQDETVVRLQKNQDNRSWRQADGQTNREQQTDAFVNMDVLT